VTIMKLCSVYKVFCEGKLVSNLFLKYYVSEESCCYFLVFTE
jgi:hypothetical protein